MEIFRLFGSIFVKDEATKKIDEVEKKSDGLQGTFKKVGGAIVAAFAVDKVIDFGKTLVQTAANIQALDSQFEQTFKDNAGNALVEINKQVNEQGINVDRLKGTWSSFYGTFRGGGAEQNQALDLTSKYMTLAGDASAYYDTSLEDVVSRLKSLTMGNFEAGDAIGLNLNATKLDTLAKQQYNKAWKDLSDTEKQYLIIDTASKIYENSGAFGQGAREANNLSNVTGNLKATWDRLLSTIGSPILAVVVDVIKQLGNGVEYLTTWVQGFDLTQFISQLDNTGGVAGSLGASLTLLRDIFIVVRDSIIEVITTIVAKAQEWYINNQATIDRLVQTFNTALGYIKQIFTDAVTIIKALWDTFGKFIFDTIAFQLQLIMDRVRNVLGIISGIFQTISSLIKGEWEGVWNGIKTIFSNALEFVIRLLVEQLLGNFIKKIGEWGTSLLSKIKSIFSNVTSGFSGLVGSIKNAISPVLDIITAPFRGAFDGITGWIDKIKNAVSNMFNTYIKKPRFSFSGSLNPMKWDKEGLPKLGIEWYAEGGILTKPTVFGMNGNNAMVGGEAGAEAVLPLQKLWDALDRNFSTLEERLRSSKETNADNKQLFTLNIENFTNNSDKDIEQLAYELEFYRQRIGRG